MEPYMEPYMEHEQRRSLYALFKSMLRSSLKQIQTFPRTRTTVNRCYSFKSLFDLPVVDIAKLVFLSV